MLGIYCLHHENDFKKHFNYSIFSKNKEKKILNFYLFLLLFLYYLKISSPILFIHYIFIYFKNIIKFLGN